MWANLEIKMIDYKKTKFGYLLAKIFHVLAKNGKKLVYFIRFTPQPVLFRF